MWRCTSRHRWLDVADRRTRHAGAVSPVFVWVLAVESDYGRPHQCCGGVERLARRVQPHGVPVLSRSCFGRKCASGPWTHSNQGKSFTCNPARTYRGAVAIGGYSVWLSPSLSSSESRRRRLRAHSRLTRSGGDLSCWLGVIGFLLVYLVWSWRRQRAWFLAMVDELYRAIRPVG